MAGGPGQHPLVLIKQPAGAGRTGSTTALTGISAGDLCGDEQKSLHCMDLKAKRLEEGRKVAQVLVPRARPGWFPGPGL